MGRVVNMEFKKTENGFTYTPKEEPKPYTKEEKFKFLFASIILATVIFIKMPKDMIDPWMLYIVYPVVLVIASYIGITIVLLVSKEAAKSAARFTNGKVGVVEILMIVIYMASMVFAGFLISLVTDFT